MADASPTSSDKHAVILFDGVCNLCNESINFIIDHDPKGYFKFAPLQKEAGKAQLKPFEVDESQLDSVILIENGKLYTQSTAALKIARKLSGVWPLCYAFIIIPPFIRNAVYAWVARNRYKWFGKRETCRFPTPDIKSRFLALSE